MNKEKTVVNIEDKLEADGEKKVIKVPDEERFWKSLGVKHSKSGQYFLNQVIRCQWLSGGDSEDDKIKAAINIFQGFEPENELEASLVAQMLAVHSVAMEMTKRAMIPDQSVDGVTICINRASKFMNLYLKQIDALMKLKGKGSQSITVKHVHVEDGGQAIVGDVHQGGSNG